MPVPATSKVRIAVGCDGKLNVPWKVLAMSVRRRTDADVEAVPTMGADWHIPHIPVGTPQAFQRFRVPKVFGWHGRAIYLEATQIVLGDIWDLWTMPEQVYCNPKTVVWACHQPDRFTAVDGPQTSVMVIDCAKARSNGMGWYNEQTADYFRDEANQTREAFAGWMRGEWMDPRPYPIPDVWNHRNLVQKGNTKLLRFSDEALPPWQDPDHPFAQMWKMELVAAISLNAFTFEEFKAECDAWVPGMDGKRPQGLHPTYREFFPATSVRMSAKERERTIAEQLMYWKESSDGEEAESA